MLWLERFNLKINAGDIFICGKTKLECCFKFGAVFQCRKHSVDKTSAATWHYPLQPDRPRPMADICQ